MNIKGTQWTVKYYKLWSLVNQQNKNGWLNLKLDVFEFVFEMYVVLLFI